MLPEMKKFEQCLRDLDSLSMTTRYAKEQVRASLDDKIRFATAHAAVVKARAILRPQYHTIEDAILAANPTP